MPEVVLAPAAAGDRAALEALVRAWYAEDGIRFDPGRQGAALDALTAGEPSGLAWLIHHAGETVGYVVVALGFSLESGGRDALIDELYVVPSARGRGLGGAVLALIEGEARRRGLKRLYLEVAHGNRAVDLYRRAGFVDHRRYLMSKDL